MKKLKNWDNKTWLSSKSYISQFNKFLKTKINLNKNSKILDIGCGRANIISALQKKYKFRNKPIGIDIVANKDVKKNIVFKRIDALKYLEKKDKYSKFIGNHAATQSYGGQFHFDPIGIEERPILMMDGFAGQQIVIDFNKN